MRKTKQTRGFKTNQLSTPRIESVELRLLMSTYTVNTLSDAITPVMGQLTLRQAVADANSNPGSDTIAFSPAVFTPGTLHTVTLTQGELLVTGNTTFNGPGSSVLAVSGDSASRVFQISSGVSVSISGMTITDGSVVSAAGTLALGGAVLNAGTLNLTGVTVSNSSALGGDFDRTLDDYLSTAGSASGGGIFSTGTLSLTNSTVTGNTARGGASFYGYDGNSSGGGIYSAGPLTISSSAISSDIAASGAADVTQNGNGGESDGGGIYVTGALSISATTLSNNTAAGGDGQGYAASFDPGGPGNGGAIYATASTTLSGDTFTANTATGGNSGGGFGYGSPASGGAIFSSSSLAITATTLQGNNAIGGDGAFDDNGAGGNGSGGAIEALGSLSISNSSILSNDASGGYGAPHSGDPNSSAFGGGIYSAVSLTLLDSTVSGNLAVAGQGGTGGGPYGGAGGTGEGGGVYISGTAMITDSTLSGNSAKGGLGESPYENGGVGGNGGNGDGGAVYSNALLTITNSTLAGNSASGGAGGFSYGGTGGNGANGVGSAVYSIDTLDIYDSTISGNTTAGGAAGGNSYSFFPYPAGSAGFGSAAIRTEVTQGMDAMDNTIVSGNIANGSTEDDILGDFDSTNSNFNLIGTDSPLSTGVNGNIVGVDNPMLSPLANNGGPVQTMLPLYDSPVVNAGGDSFIPTGMTTDQRGYVRIASGTVDIGAVELQKASVSGLVFNDTNGDGIQETGETGLAGVTVYADLADAGFYQSGDPSAVTGTNGTYVLNGVPEGDVIIRQETPAGHRQSYPAGGDGDHVNVTPAGITGALFADSTRLYVSGTVTYNGVGESGVTVYADLNNDGKFESNENNKTSLSNGSFAFVSLTAGTYTFRVVTPAGQMISGNSAITVTLGSGGIDQDVNFTLVPASQSTKLTGTIIGTAGSYDNDGNTIAKAFDGILTNYFDGPTANGDYAGLNFGKPEVITSLAYDPRAGFASRMVGGIFQGSNNPGFIGAVNLYAITTSPPNDTLTTVAISNTTAFQYVRYLAPNGSYGDVGELAFYGYARTETQLTGTVIGTSGSYQNQGNTIANVFDGNLNTYFDAPSASGSWVGLDLGTAQVVTEVSYAPRSGWANRMVGGEIQASNSANFSAGVVTLFTISSTPTTGVLTTQLLSNTTAYRYYRYIGPADSYCNIAELEFDA